MAEYEEIQNRVSKCALKHQFVVWTEERKTKVKEEKNDNKRIRKLGNQYAHKKAAADDIKVGSRFLRFPR